MIQGRRVYNVEEILNSVSHEDIFRKYCPNFKQVGAFFKSEFRSDSNPSCVINPTNTGLKYKDFGERLDDSMSYLRTAKAGGRKYPLFRGLSTCPWPRTILLLSPSLAGVDPRTISGRNTPCVPNTWSCYAHGAFCMA